MLVNYRLIRRSKWQIDGLKLLFLLTSIVGYFVYSVQPKSPFKMVYQQEFCRQVSGNGTVQVDRELLDYLIVLLHERPMEDVDHYIRLMTVIRGLEPLTGVKALVPGMGPVVNDISWFQYLINLAPCADVGPMESYRISLFVGVISAPHYFEKRSVLRQTWRRHLTTQSNIRNNPLDVVGFGFVIGLTDDEAVQQKIKEESDKYGDILQINMNDTYSNLSLKVAGLLNWVNTYCSPVDFILKVDDDVYVNVHNLATVLHSLTPSEPSVYGHQVGDNVPSRVEGKWSTSFELWPWHRFPFYFQGAGLVITGSAVNSLLAAIQVTPYFIWEDLYLTGLCAVKAKVQLRTSSQIFVDEPEDDSDPCLVRNSVMWTTESVDGMRSSHFVSQCFYQTPPKVRCIFNNRIYDEPANASDFSFVFADQN